MDDFHISIGLIDKASGVIERGTENFESRAFGGVVPSIGDRILDPGIAVKPGESRPNFSDPERHIFWVVEERIFRPEVPGCILVCRTEKATKREINLL